jgi:hypothetical protein
MGKVSKESGASRDRPASETHPAGLKEQLITVLDRWDRRFDSSDVIAEEVIECCLRHLDLARVDR